MKGRPHKLSEGGSTCVCVSLSFLTTVISKLVQRGYQPHLEDFLLRLNFNNFYG